MLKKYPIASWVDFGPLLPQLFDVCSSCLSRISGVLQFPRWRDSVQDESNPRRRWQSVLQLRTQDLWMEWFSRGSPTTPWPPTRRSGYSEIMQHGLFDCDLWWELVLSFGVTAWQLFSFFPLGKTTRFLVMSEYSKRPFYSYLCEIHGMWTKGYVALGSRTTFKGSLRWSL